jgi:hypothetical protein
MPVSAKKAMYLMREVIRGHQWMREVIRGHQWMREVIRGHQWMREVIRGHPVPDEGGHRSRSEALRERERERERHSVAISGHQWPSAAISVHRL